MPVRISWPVVIGVLHPNIGGCVSAYFSMRNFDPWYQNLKRPTWTPPNWAFAPAWTILYSTMGYSSYLVWRDGGGFEGAALPLTIYGANLALNWAWSPIFFGAHKVKWALYEIVVLLGSTAAMAVSFHQVNPVAGYLNVPYLLWTAFATALNYAIYKENRVAIEDPKKS